LWRASVALSVGAGRGVPCYRSRLRSDAPSTARDERILPLSASSMYLFRFFFYLPASFTYIYKRLRFRGMEATFSFRETHLLHVYSNFCYTSGSRLHLRYLTATTTTTRDLRRRDWQPTWGIR